MGRVPGEGLEWGKKQTTAKANAGILPFAQGQDDDSVIGNAEIKKERLLEGSRSR
jgi:hypothetical protein